MQDSLRFFTILVSTYGSNNCYLFLFYFLCFLFLRIESIHPHRILAKKTIARYRKAEAVDHITVVDQGTCENSYVGDLYGYWTVFVLLEQPYGVYGLPRGRTPSISKARLLQDIELMLVTKTRNLMLILMAQ